MNQLQNQEHDMW